MVSLVGLALSVRRFPPAWPGQGRCAGPRRRGGPTWHPRFADFAGLVGIVAKLCRPYRAQTKGRVERLVRYVRENFGQAGSSPTARTSTTRSGPGATRPTSAFKAPPPHGPGRRAAAFAQPVPERSRIEYLLGEERSVSRDGFVSWDGSRGVPWAFSRRTAVVKDRDRLLEFWDARAQIRIALHPKSSIRGATLPLPGQWDGIPLGGSGPERGVLATQIAALRFKCGPWLPTKLAWEVLTSDRPGESPWPWA